YIPYGKFFHIFQRPAHLAVILYRREGEAAPKAACRRCGSEFAGAMHVADLRQVMPAMGLALDLGLCPACKRKQLGTAQAAAMRRSPEPAGANLPSRTTN